MSYKIEDAATAVLEAIEIAAAEVEFDESKVKRAKDGKFAKKDGSATTEPSAPSVADMALIDRVKTVSADAGDALKSIAENNSAIKGVVATAVNAYEKATKTSTGESKIDSAARSIGANYLQAQKSIAAIQDYVFTKKDFPNEKDPKKVDRQTQLVADLKKNVGKTVAAISALLDPSTLADRMTEASKWLKTKTDNTLEGAGKFLDGLLKAAGDRLGRSSPQKAPVLANVPPVEPVKPAPLESNPPAKLAKKQIESVVNFSKTVSDGFAAAAHSELATKEWEFLQGQAQGIGKLATNAIDKGMKNLSEIDYRGGLEVAGKKIKETAAKAIDDVGTLTDELVVMTDLGGVNRDKLRVPIVKTSDNPKEVVKITKAPNTIDQAKSELVDYSGRVGRAIFGVLTAKAADTIGKIPQKFTEKKAPDILPPAATQLDNIKKNLGLKYNSPKAKTPLGRLGQNIDNSLRQEGQKIVNAIDEYGKDVERNKPLIGRDLGLPKLRDFILTDDMNSILNFKDRADQLLEGVNKTRQDKYDEVDRATDLNILRLEGMRRLQNLKELIGESIQQSALDYQAAARKRLEAKAAAAQQAQV